EGNMKKLFGGSAIVALLLLGTMVAAGAPLCSSLIGTDLLSPLLAGGCQSDDGRVLFSNFNYSSAGGSLGSTASVTLTDGSTTGKVINGLEEIAFNPNLNSPIGVFDVHLTFVVTALSGFVHGAYLNNGGTNTTINELNCVGATFQGTSNQCNQGGVGTFVWN